MEWGEAVRTATKKQIQVHIRWMIRRDMPEVLRMEAASFGEHAWPEEEFIRILRQRNCIAMVAEVSEQIVGYMVYELNRGAIRILNLAACPAGKGIRRTLMQKLTGSLAGNGPGSSRKSEKRTLTLNCFSKPLAFDASGRCETLERMFMNLSSGIGRRYDRS